MYNKNVNCKHYIKTIFIALFSVFTTTLGYCQDKEAFMAEAAKIYTGIDPSKPGLIAGFSIWGLVISFLFSGIGFIAFMYGKKNTEFKPMLIGIALMIYPYFLRSTLTLTLVGIALTAALYFFRE